jgi:hypothetical protein
MSGVSGLEVKAAVKKAATWGTPVACGANDGILILEPSIDKERGDNVDDSLGLYFPQDSDPGEITVDGDLPMYLRYDSIDLLIAMAMGATGGAPVQQGSTTAYKQVISLASALDGLFCTLALNKKINVEELPSIKVMGFTIEGEVGKPLKITFAVKASNRNINTTGGTNNLTSFNNVTYFETGNRVLFNQGVFRMNDQSAAALGSGDVIYPNSFKFTFMRKMEGVYGAGGTFDVIDEPTNDDVPEIKLELGFPRYTSEAYFTDWDNETPKKMDITFTGAQIQNPYNREFNIAFPNLKFSKVEAPIEKGIIKHPVELNVLGAASAPAGMTVTNPFEITFINRQSSDVLQ